MGLRSRYEGIYGGRADDGDARLTQGVDLLSQNKPDSAERIFRAVLEGFADSAVAHSLLAMALADQGRGREAMGAAADAIGIDPHLALAHAARACALEVQGLPWEAEMEARQALALAPNDPNRHSDLAGIVGRAGRYKEALAITDKGLGLNPQHLPSLHCRALALVSLGRHDDAQEVLAGALLEDPDMAQLRASIGRALESRGEIGRAADEYRESLRLDNSVMDAHEGLARLKEPTYKRFMPSSWRRRG